VDSNNKGFRPDTLAYRWLLADRAVFQTVFGMIFTVIIALEFHRTILLINEPQ
jgi:hypothetical protein